MRPQCIAVCGPDGAGKTTLCDTLAKELEKSGLSVHKCWLRFRHRATLPLLAYARLTGHTMYRADVGQEEKLGFHRFEESPILRKVYPWAVWFDLGPSVYWHVNRKLKRGTWVVVDRFVPDTLVDLQIETGRRQISANTVGRALLKYIPRNSLVIILDAPSDTLRERRPVHENDPSLETRRALYKELCESHGWMCLEATRDPSEIADGIMERALIGTTL